MMLSKVLATFAVTLCLFSQTTFAQATTAPCQVPVCDIKSTIADLSTKTPDDRATYFSQLYQNYSASTDAATVRNLRDFGTQGYALTKKLNDPTYVVLWATSVRQIGIYGVLSYAPFEKNEATFSFIESSKIAELSRERQQQIRYAAFYRWKIEIPTLMDLKMIYDLYDFLNSSAQLSRSLKDDEYVLREAATTLDLLGKRISYLYPIYEGVFEIKTQCLPAATSCDNQDLKVDRIVMMNSLTDLGVFASVPTYSKTNFNSSIGSEKGRPADDINFLFAKSKVQTNGTTLNSQSDVLTVGPIPSEIAVSIDPGTQYVKASVTTTHTPGALHLEGKVLFTPLKYYIDTVPTTPQAPAIVGIFDGFLGDQKMKIIIRQRLDTTLMATAVVGEKDEAKKIEFSMGTYVPHRQIIQLTGIGSVEFTPYKMTLAYRYGTDQQLHWTGGFFSTTGYFKAATVNYTGPVQEGNGPDADLQIFNLKFN